MSYKIRIKRSTIWFAITLIFTIGTFGLSSISVIYIPAVIVRYWIHIDWVLHALEYGVLALCMLMYFHETRFTARQTFAAYLCTLLFSGIIGLLNEIWQAHVPHRSPSWSDEVANLLGAALFIGLFHIFKLRGKK